MRWITDEDRERIEIAASLTSSHNAKKLLVNIVRLGLEQPHPEPRIVPLDPAEHRRIYPERYI